MRTIAVAFRQAPELLAISLVLIAAGVARLIGVRGISEEQAAENHAA